MLTRLLSVAANVLGLEEVKIILAPKYALVGASLVAQLVKNLPAIKGTWVRSLGSPGEGKGYPLQYSGLENPMDYMVHEVAKSWTRLSDFHFHSHTPFKGIIKY